MCLSSTLPGSQQGIALTRVRLRDATLAAVVHTAVVVVWHTAADARLAIRSRASDCRITDTYDLYTYRDHRASQQPIHTHNRALQSLSLSLNPTSHKLPGTRYTRATQLRQTSGPRAPHASEKPLPCGKHRAAKLDPSLIKGARMTKTLTGTTICSSTRADLVSVREAAWWLQMSNLKTLALLLRFDARSSASRLRQMPPRTPDRSPMADKAGYT